MKQKILQKVKKMARNAGYHDAKAIGKWKGYEVAEPIFTDGVVHYIGIPMFILVKDGTMRWTVNWQESKAIMERHN